MLPKKSCFENDGQEDGGVTVGCTTPSGPVPIENINKLLRKTIEDEPFGGTKLPEQQTEEKPVSGTKLPEPQTEDEPVGGTKLS